MPLNSDPQAVNNARNLLIEEFRGIFQRRGAPLTEAELLDLTMAIDHLIDMKREHQRPD